MSAPGLLSKLQPTSSGSLRFSKAHLYNDVLTTHPGPCQQVWPPGKSLCSMANVARLHYCTNSHWRSDSHGVSQQGAVAVLNLERKQPSIARQDARRPAPVFGLVSDRRQPASKRRVPRREQLPSLRTAQASGSALQMPRHVTDLSQGQQHSLQGPGLPWSFGCPQGSKSSRSPAASRQQMIQEFRGPKKRSCGYFPFKSD